MERRSFIKYSGVLGLGLPVSTMIPAAGPREEWLQALIGHNDEQVTSLMDRQNQEVDHPNEGGVADAYGLYHAGSAAGFIQRLTVSYVSPESRFFHQSELVPYLSSASHFLRRIQHTDGTIDLITTNFHSTPDTAFVVEPLAISLGLLQKDGHEEAKLIIESIREFLNAAGEALIIGGIHTPNHRWVVSMALARLYQLMPDERYIRRINQWLSEGIDIDPDGQFTERSTAVYSPLTDRCLITISRLTGHPELLDHVRKNLDMTLLLLHPNGEIVTECSRRQDQYLARPTTPYYYPCLFMAHGNPSGRYGGWIKQMEQALGAKELSGALPYILEDRSLLAGVPNGPVPDHYRSYFTHSGMVRIRKGSWDVTVLKDNAALVTFQSGNAVLQAVRMATAFFGKGQFVATGMEVTEETIILTQQLTGPYFQPIAPEKIVPDGDWEKMPRDQRPQSEIQKIQYRCTIQEIPTGVKMQMEITGTSGVPVAVELGFRQGGQVTGAMPSKDVPDAYLWQGEPVFFQCGQDSIRITGGKKDHEWTQLRGAQPKLDAQCVYLTGYSPLELELLIEAI